MIPRLVLVALLSLVSTVSTNPYCAGALMAQSQGQDPVMPPEGNPGDVEPPPGAYCDHSTRPAHTCNCHPHCVENPDGTLTFVEDRTHCRANCHPKHCHCGADNCKAPTAH